MSISFSRPDPSQPSAVGSASFSVGRRGFDQNEVRDFLRMVAAEMARLQEREKFLERELRSAQTRAISEPGALTEEMVTELLGEETARIITAAREAALQIRDRAEETAGRLMREASDDASRIRQEAEIDAQRVRSDAADDARAEIEMARQQGTDMVNEARQYRERVLNELSRRRELAREQIEQFEHGRDRLLSTFEKARQSTEDVISELAVETDEDAELIDLTNSTGPIEMPVARTTPGAIFDVEAEDAVDMAEHIEVEQEVEVTTVELDTLATPVTEVAVEIEPPTNVTSTVFGESPAEPSGEVTTIEPVLEPEKAPETGHVAEVVSIFDKSREKVTPAKKESKEVAEPPAPKSVEAKPTPKAKKVDAVDDLFAKLRTSNTEKVVERVKSKPAASKKAVAAEVDLAKEEANFARKLKRVLSDEQNDHFEFLRRRGAAKKMAEMLADLSEDVARYRSMLEAELMEAAVKGAATKSDDAEAALRKRLKASKALDPVFGQVTKTIIEPIRRSITKCINDCDGDAEKAISALRGVYRQWRNDNVDAIAHDLCQMAYGRGAQNTTA